MTSWTPSIYGRWFVAARADRLHGKPLAVTVLDRPLVIARMADGTVCAFEDRCPHRQVPLSGGSIVAEGLRCPYHGWVFDAGGRCVKVPGLSADACLPAAGARPVTVQVVDGLVWVRLAAGDAAPPRMITELEAGSRRFLEQMRWDANVVDAIENFLDPLHTHLIHPGLVRKDGVRRAMQVAASSTDEGFMIDYQGQEVQSGLLYRLFESPRSSERAHFAGAGAAQIEYRYQNGSVVRIILYFTPESATSTHVFTSMHVEQRWAPAWALRCFVWPFLRKVAQQDKAILEAQSANLQRFAPQRGVSTGLDLVRKRLEQIWEPERAASPPPEPERITIML